MDITGLDHVTIRTRPQDVDTLRDFYRDVVGLREGRRADFSFPGYWMYLGDCPVVHLAGILPVTAPDPAGPAGTGHVDHVSFRARGIAATREKLRGLGVRFAEVPVPGMPLHQIFFHDPAGLKIELTFYNETDSSLSS